MKKEIDAIIIEIKQEFSLVGERDWFYLLVNENRVATERNLDIILKARDKVEEIIKSGGIPNKDGEFEQILYTHIIEDPKEMNGELKWD